MHVGAAGELTDALAEVLDVVAAGEAIELLLVDARYAELLEGCPALGAARAEPGVVALGPRQHQEQLGHAAAEAEHVEGRLALPRHLDAVDGEGPTPQVIGGRRPQGQGGDLPQVEPAVERRGDDLPVADHRLLGIPAHRLRLVVSPDAQREPELVGLAVAVGDDDVAGREPVDLGAHVDHLAHGRVSRVDAPAPQLGDVDGVGERRVVDVVLSRDGEDP